MPPTHRMGSTPTLRFAFVQEDGVTALDLTGMTTLVARAKRPDGTTVDWTATVTNAPGTDGLASYTVDTADFNMEGPWHFQGHAIGGGRTWYSDEHHRTIVAPFAAPE